MGSCAPSADQINAKALEVTKLEKSMKWKVEKDLIKELDDLKNYDSSNLITKIELQKHKTEGIFIQI